MGFPLKSYRRSKTVYNRIFLKNIPYTKITSETADFKKLQLFA